MSAASTRVIAIGFTGDRVGNPTVSAAANINSPAATAAPITRAAGDNTITIPTGGAVATGVTIIKPVSSTATLKLKGAGGDTGVKLHPTDPDSISLDPTQATIILNASVQTIGVVLVWS